MNKLYAIHYYIRDNFICEFCTFDRLRFEIELNQYPDDILFRHDLNLN